MDIFEQLHHAHIMLVNQIPTINFGYEADDPDEDWCLSIYGDNTDGTGSWEYYFTREELRNAEKHGPAFLVKSTYGDTTIEFCKLVNVTDWFDRG